MQLSGRGSKSRENRTRGRAPGEDSAPCSPVQVLRVKLSAGLGAVGTAMRSPSGLGTSARCVSPAAPLYTPAACRMSRNTRVPRKALVTVGSSRGSPGRAVAVNTPGSPSAIASGPTCGAAGTGQGLKGRSAGPLPVTATSVPCGHLQRFSPIPASSQTRGASPPLLHPISSCPKSWQLTGSITSQPPPSSFSAAVIAPVSPNTQSHLPHLPSSSSQ